MAKRFTTASMAVAISVILVGGCNESSSRGADTMTKEPSWKASYDAQEGAAAARMRELIARAPTYAQPPADPGIFWTSSADNRIMLVERATGNFIIFQQIDRERNLMDFRWTTENRQLVCIFTVKIGRPIAGSPTIVPLRLFHIQDSPKQKPDIAALRRQMTLPRLAQFLTAWPGFGDSPDRRFVLIDAPVEQGERL